jgi:hypothetical protein
MQRAHQSPRCTAHSKPWLSMQKSCGARLGGMSDAWRRWWSAYWPSASELSPRVTDEGYVRDARHDTGVKRNYRMGGHIILWQGIAEPPQIANFFRVQYEGKKLPRRPMPPRPKRGTERGSEIGCDALTSCKYVTFLRIMVLLERIELSTSPLPRECSASELQQQPMSSD